MPTPLRYLLSLLFNFQMYLAMPLVALAFLPWAAVSRTGAVAAVHAYCRWVRLSAHWMVGLRSEIRGPVPQGAFIVASKHQSFFDIILLCSVLPRPRFVMKRVLQWAPVLGWYALRIGCIPVDRGKGSTAIAQLLAGLAATEDDPGQLVIYPQGTRVAPGTAMPYKVGAGIIYSQSGQTCIPAATNVGVFWPRKGVMRRPGLAVVEFLEPVPPGLGTTRFMAELERRIETASDALMAEAGFAPPSTR